MFGIDAIAGIAGGLLGGGDKGGGGGPIKQDQTGQLSSGSGEFNFGGSKTPGWIWPVVIGVVAIVGLFIWKPWKA